jgi:hypothetical protein
MINPAELALPAIMKGRLTGANEGNRETAFLISVSLCSSVQFPIDSEANHPLFRKGFGL